MLLARWNLTRLLLKHAVAAVTVIIGSTLFAAAAHVAMSIVAVATGGLGSRLSFFVMTLAGVRTGVAGVAVLLPLTILLERLTARTGLRSIWQIPIAAAVLVALLTVVEITNAAAHMVPAPRVTLTLAGFVTAATLAMSAVYWTALQSTDWVLRTGLRIAGRLWPSRFGALARSQYVVPFRGPAGIARFRVKELFTLDAGATPMLIVSGDILDGVVRGGMRACTIVDAREVSARIHSVEYVDQIASRAHNVGLLLSLSEQDLRMWKAAAIEGTVLRIV